MTIHEHQTSFGGKPVVEWDPEASVNPLKNAVRISLDWDAAEEGSRWVDRFVQFLDVPGANKTTALLVGNWGETASGSDSAPVVEALVSYRDRLPLLEALFLGDIIMEESEISWINQTDVGPLFHAFAKLREFVVRGGSGLAFGNIRHGALESLTVQTGGLDGSVVRNILASELSQLSHLELWLGDEGYGATTTVEDLGPLLAGKIFPNLKYLGLRNSEIADEVAAAVANAPLLSRLETLDISMGTLGDEGAKALAGSPSIGKLRHLSIAHHYVDKALVKELESKVKSLDASEPEKPEDWGDGELHRYVSVSE